jgi:hypothetical protein
MDERYSVRDSRAKHFQAWTLEESIERISKTDVYVLTGFFNVLEAEERDYHSPQ